MIVFPNMGLCGGYNVMRSIGSSFRGLSRKGITGIALLGLVWVAPALSCLRSAALFAHASVANGDGSIAQLDIAQSQGYNDAATNSGDRPAPPPEPTEWIAAWIDDLKQSNERWIEVDLSSQELFAWEGNLVVFSAPVSTGREGDWTPPGVYAIETKYDKAWMQGDDYDIPNVPYVMYFFGSYAIHGAYWRDSFGTTPASRGCVSMSVEQAEWLYSWASEGTHVVIER